MKDILLQQQEFLKKYGWFVHFIIDDDRSPYGVNYHTHGLEKSFNHKNIQIVYPVSQQVAHAILSTLVDRIKKGEKFEPNRDYDKVIEKFYVHFIEARESGRDVLRLVFPGSDGTFTGGAVDQFTMLDNNDSLDEVDKIFAQD